MRGAGYNYYIDKMYFRTVIPLLSDAVNSTQQSSIFLTETLFKYLSNYAIHSCNKIKKYAYILVKLTNSYIVRQIADVCLFIKYKNVKHNKEKQSYSLTNLI